MKKEQEELLKLKRKLLNEGIIMKEKDIALYDRIKFHEIKLRKFFGKEFNYNLLSTKDYVRLEKIPVEGKVQSWMTLKIKGQKKNYELKKKSDFIFLCIILHFLSEKGKGTQFLLNEMVEDARVFCAKRLGKEISFEGKVEGKKNRTSFVTAAKFAEYYGCMKVVAESYEDLGTDESTQALLKVTDSVDHLMNTIFKKVDRATNLKELMEENELNEEILSPTARTKIVRKLMLSPIVFMHDLEEDELDYINDPKKRTELSVFFDLELGMAIEWYEDMFYTVDEYNRIFENFPKTRTDVDGAIVLNKDATFTKLVVLYMNEIAQKGNLEITKFEGIKVLEKIISENDDYIAKSLKAKKTDVLFVDLINEMRKWLIVNEVEKEVYSFNEFVYRLKPELIKDEEDENKDELL